MKISKNLCYILMLMVLASCQKGHRKFIYYEWSIQND